MGGEVRPMFQRTKPKRTRREPKLIITDSVPEGSFVGAKELEGAQTISMAQATAQGIVKDATEAMPKPLELEAPSPATTGTGEGLEPPAIKHNRHRTVEIRRSYCSSSEASRNSRRFRPRQVSRRTHHRTIPSN